MEKRHERHGDKDKSPLEAIVVGAIFMGVFGGIWLVQGMNNWFWLFPAAFAGFLPMIGGIRRLFSGTRKRREQREYVESDRERQILKAAHERHGRLTAAGAALATDLSIQEAQTVLEKMVKDGHASMDVTANGTIEYEFRDFLPHPEEE
ncbi:MAG TPA: hypothetical protein ENN69_03780 [Spirochaetia bacterium]|nr:hypothetical protein [Spirochaetia bacterium]